MTGNMIRNLIGIGTVVVLVGAVAAYRETARPPPTPGPDKETASTQPAALPRMVDLGADKCIPCKEMAPILVELRKEYAGRAMIEFIDVWKDPKAADAYDVRIIPTQIFFDRLGKELSRHEGFLSKAEITAQLKELGA